MCSKMVAYSTEAFHHPNYYYSNKHKSIFDKETSNRSPNFSTSPPSPSNAKSLDNNFEEGESINAPYIIKVYKRQQEYLKYLVEISSIKEKERLQKLRKYNLRKEDVNSTIYLKKKLSNTQAKDSMLEREREYLRNRELERRKRHKKYEERFEAEREREREMIENAKMDIKVLLKGIAKEYYKREYIEEEIQEEAKTIKEAKKSQDNEDEEDDMMSPPRVKNINGSDQCTEEITDGDLNNKLALNRDVYQNVPCKVDSNNIYTEASKELCISPRTGINVHTWKPQKKPIPENGIYISMSEDRNIEYDSKSYRIKKLQWSKYENPKYGKPKPEKGLYDEKHCHYMSTNKVKETAMKEEKELASMRQNIERQIVSKEKDLKDLKEMWLKSYDS